VVPEMNVITIMHSNILNHKATPVAYQIFFVQTERPLDIT